MSFFQHLTPFRPGPGRRDRFRRCLLKGCEQAFVPSHPQARYCSVTCTRSARQWRRWRASRCYRASESGRKRRRAQNSRYRQRQRERAEVVAAAVSVPVDPVAAGNTGIPIDDTAIPAGDAAVPATDAADVPATDAADDIRGGSAEAPSDGREGQRPAEFCEHFEERACLRPGCYVVFGVRYEHSNRHFCSVACRLALRRVLDRESRYRWRRQPGQSWRVTGRCQPPDTS